MKLIAFIIIITLSKIQCQRSRFPLSLLHEWKVVEPQFADDQTKTDALASGQYIPGNMVPIDVNAEYVSRDGGRRVFLTFPRFNIGRPFTLGVITNNSQIDSKASPYPNYSWHNDERNCSKIVNAFRTAIDTCDRLWVLDSGTYLQSAICPPKLLIFNLLNDTLIDTYVIPNAVHRNYSLIINPLVDIRNNSCDQPFAYLSDVLGNRLIVVDYARKQSWRIENKYFYPDPNYGTFEVNGIKFELMDGMFGSALSPANPNNLDAERTLYFSPLTSVHLGKVPSSIVRNQTLFIGNTRAAPEQFILSNGERESPSGPCVMDSKGIMFFGTHGDSSLNCWNHNRTFGKRNIERVATSETLLPFVTSIKIVINGSGNEELWIMTTNFGKAFTGTLTNDVVNFRIFVGDPERLGASCRA